MNLAHPWPENALRGVQNARASIGPAGPHVEIRPANQMKTGKIKFSKCRPKGVTAAMPDFEILARMTNNKQKKVKIAGEKSVYAVGVEAPASKIYPNENNGKMLGYCKTAANERLASKFPPKK
jgi:hypothetical protein